MSRGCFGWTGGLCRTRLGAHPSLASFLPNRACHPPPPAAVKSPSGATWVVCCWSPVPAPGTGGSLRLHLLESTGQGKGNHGGWGGVGKTLLVWK